MECRAHDCHNFLNDAWQTVDVRKAREMVMKSEIVYNTTCNTLTKNFGIFDHEKNGLKKVLNFCLIVYI